MDDQAPHIDSRSWTGLPDYSAASRFDLPSGGYAKESRLTARKGPANRGPVILFTAIAGGWWLSRLPDWLIPAWSVERPDVAAPLAMLGGVAAILILWRRAGPRSNRASLILAPSVLVLIAGNTLSIFLAYAVATADPPVRAKILGIQSDGSYRSRRTKLFIVSSDRKSFTAETAQPLSATTKARCFEGRRWSAGPYAWFKVEAGSPLPKAGQLSWPVDAAQCFGSTKLEELTGR